MTILLQGAGLQATVSTPAGLTPLLDLEADTLVLSDGDLVSTWADQSGNGYDFTQSGAARPTYNLVGGIPQVTPDGIDDWMLGPDFADNFASCTFIFAFYFPGAQSGTRPLMAKMNNTSSGAGWFIWNNGDGILLQEDGGSNWTQISWVSHIPQDHYYVLSVEVSNLNTIHTYVNGVQVALEDFSAPPISNIGTIEAVRLFTDGALEGFSSAPLRAARIYTPALNATDRATVEAELAARYGITL